MPKRDESIEIAQRVKTELENEPKKVAAKLWSAVPAGMTDVPKEQFLDMWRRNSGDAQFHVDMIKSRGPAYYFASMQDAFPQYKPIIRLLMTPPDKGGLDPKEIAPLRLPFMPAPPPPPIVPEMGAPMPVPGGEMVGQAPVEPPIEPMIQPPMEVGNGQL